MSFGQLSGGSDGGRRRMMSEINVTPLVDVMLVLLIIFMVTAPMMTQGLEIDVPKTDTSKPLDVENNQTIISIKANGEIYLDDDLGTLENLDAQIKQIMTTKGNNTIFLKADTRVSYGDVARVISKIQSAGVSSLSLVTQQGTPGDTMNPNEDPSKTTPPAAREPFAPQGS